MHEDDSPDDCCFTHEQIDKFSKALGIDKRLVDSDLLCLNKKVERLDRLQIDKQFLLDAWFSPPNSFKTCPRGHDIANRNVEPKVIFAGASPRSSSCLLHGTSTHPNLTRLVTAFIRQQRPDFKFTTFTIREDLSRHPHWDTRNGPCGTFFQVISKGWEEDCGLRIRMGLTCECIMGLRLQGST